MNPNSNWKRGRSLLPVLLTVMVVLSSVAVAITGIVLKYAYCRPAGILQDTFAMAVPFILMEDASMREALVSRDEPETLPPPSESGAPSFEATESESESGSNQEPAVAASFGPVDDSYWEGVLFIGDSRTDGLRLYAPMEKADYFSSPSLNSYDILSDSTVLSMPDNYENHTLVQLLSERQYHAVYVMLGINEIGHSVDGIQAKYQQLLDTIQDLQPQALIVVQANLHVTQALGEKNPELALPRLQDLNSMLAGLADNTRIFYLDVNPIFCDENGYLLPEITKDGCHPYAAEYQKWKDFLMQNGIQ